MTLHVCAMTGCPNLTERTYCRTCAPLSSRNHGGVPRQQREHGATYDALAREMRGQPCALGYDGCTGVASGADLIVPRSQGGRATRDNAQPACSHCQSVQGGRLARGMGVESPPNHETGRTAQQPLSRAYGPANFGESEPW